MRSGGFASGILVVVLTVWNAWMTLALSSVLSSEEVWIIVVLFSLSDSSGCVGLCVGLGLWGASRRESREVFASCGIA